MHDIIPHVGWPLVGLSQDPVSFMSFYEDDMSPFSSPISLCSFLQTENRYVSSYNSAPGRNVLLKEKIFNLQLKTCSPGISMLRTGTLLNRKSLIVQQHFILDIERVKMISTNTIFVNLMGTRAGRVPVPNQILY